MADLALVTTPRARQTWASRALADLNRRAAIGLAPLESMADQLADAVFVVDAERNILLFNRRAEEITGFSRSDVLGRHCLAGIRCARCLESCGIFDRVQIAGVALELFRADGSPIEVIKSASVIRDAAGTVIGAVEVFRERVPEATDDFDIRAATLHNLETLIESVGRGFLILDTDLKIHHASTRLADLLGTTAEILRGRPAAEVLGEDLFGPDSPFRHAILAGQRREGWRASLCRANGDSQPVSVTGAPLMDGLQCGGEPGAHGGRYLLMVRPEIHTSRDSRSDAVHFEGMAARSEAMRQVFQLIDHLRDSDASVLITGESGTGKELVARAIHARSGHANQPFVAVNCGALPMDLLESELFGHARGAFTGAVRDRPGRFEVAGDGTIFLDEIGDLPLALQVKLLRVLQERTFERVGETQSRPFRARVVAATHQDLTELVSRRQFRDDLFYRLNVVPINLPPLRARREDIDLLVHRLLDRIGARRSRALGLSPSAMRTLLSCDWPGNVRQLENALEYATAVCEGQTIHDEDLPVEILSAPETRPAEPGSTVLGPFPNRDDILEALRRSRNRRGAAAELLGISRTTLWRRLKELGLG